MGVDSEFTSRFIMGDIFYEKGYDIASNWKKIGKSSTEICDV